ncbi:MAG: hypothetical protein QW594_02150 [Candidatus Woesearchaeota archaeon]
MEDLQPFEPRGSIILPNKHLPFDLRVLPALDYHDKPNPYAFWQYLLETKTPHIHKTKYGITKDGSFLKPLDRIFIVPEEKEKDITVCFGPADDSLGGNVQVALYYSKAPRTAENEKKVKAYVTHLLKKYTAYGLDANAEKSLLYRLLTADEKYYRASTLLVYNTAFIASNQAFCYPFPSSNDSRR